MNSLDRTTGGRLRSVASAFGAWITGRAPARPRPAWWRWTSRAVAVAVLAYVFLYGPGVRLWSSPPGFHKLVVGTVTVLFQPGMESEAGAVAAAAIEAEQRILGFWGRTQSSGFDFPVKIFLCRDQDRYWHLVMNRAKASAAGNQVMIHASYPEHERTGFLCHELAHLFVVHEFGWLESRMRSPAWLDEGIATTLQGSHWNDRNGLAGFAWRTRELASLRSTSNTLRWLGAVSAGGDRAGVQYAYVRAFTEDLMARYGSRTVRDFLTRATRSGDHEGSFELSFGLSLREAEQSWLDQAMQSGLLPEDLRMVNRGLPTGLLVKLMVAASLLLFAALWIVRQVGRLTRAVLRRRSTNTL